MRLDLFNDRAGDYKHLRSLASYSPHLLLHLERIFSDESLSKIEEVFAFFLHHGGLKELDFERPIGEVKYNPRPARIVLILIRDAGIRDLEMLRVAIAASCLELGEANSSILAVLDSREMELAQSVSLFQESWLKDAEMGVSKLISDRDQLTVKPNQLLLCLAIFLDRIRHVHRSSRKVELLPRLISEAQILMSCSEHMTESAGIRSVSGFIRHWLKRVKL